MESENVRLARRWFEEVWNQRLEETIDELLTDESVCRTETEIIRGREQFREGFYWPMIDAFPELRVEVEATLDDGDEVVVRWSATGTHRGGGLGFAATGREVRMLGMTWLRFQDGRMLEGWQVSNLEQVFRSLRESVDPVPTLQASVGR